MRRLVLYLAFLAAPATAQESLHTSAEQALHRAGVFDDQALYAQRDQLLPGQCDIQPGSGLAQVTRLAIDAQKDGDGFLPAFRLPCSMSIRNFHDVVFVEDRSGLRPLVGEVPVIEFGVGPDGLPDWRLARIDGYSRSAILTDFEPDVAANRGWFSVPQSLDSNAIVSVQVALPTMAILTVTVSGRDGSGSVTLLDNRPREAKE